jgi:hypothetical protein
VKLSSINCALVSVALTVTVRPVTAVDLSTLRTDPEMLARGPPAVTV